MEQLLDAFLASCGDLAPAVFAVKYPHPFLVREIMTGDQTRKLTREEIEAQAQRIRRLGTRGSGYVLSQYGALSVESLLRDVTVAGTQELKTHITPIAPQAGKSWPLSFGAGPGADVIVVAKGVAPIVLTVAPGPEESFEITPAVEGIWYDEQPREPGASFALEEGLILQLSADTSFQTFTPSGLALLLAFRVALLAAKARAPRLESGT
jgi:hypothetical protein